MDDKMEIIVTDKKTVKHFFQTILYDTVLTNTHKIILSTIHKHKHIVERFLLPFLKIYDWKIDEEIHNEEEFKPKEEIKEYDDGSRVTHLKYHLIRDTYTKEIMREVLKDKKNQEAFIYLLDKLDIHRKELDDEEAMSLLMSLSNYIMRKNIKQFKAFEKYLNSAVRERMK